MINESYSDCNSNCYRVIVIKQNSNTYLICDFWTQRRVKLAEKYALNSSGHVWQRHGLTTNFVSLLHLKLGVS